MSMTSCGLSETLVKINLEVSSTYLKVSLVARSLDVTVDVFKLILVKDIIGRVETVVSIPVLRYLVGHHTLRISECNLYREIDWLTVEVGVAQTLPWDELNVPYLLNNRICLVVHTVHEVFATEGNTKHVGCLGIRLLVLKDMTNLLVSKLEYWLTINVDFTCWNPLSELKDRIIRVNRQIDVRQINHVRVLHSLIENIESLLTHVNSFVKDFLLYGVPSGWLELLCTLVVEVAQVEYLGDDRSLRLNYDELDVTFLDNLVVDSVLKFYADKRSSADDRLRSVLAYLGLIRLAGKRIGVAV